MTEPPQFLHLNVAQSSLDNEIENNSCLLDSGATDSTVNSIGKQYLLELGYRMIRLNAIESTMADGSKRKVNKYFSVPVEYDNNVALIKFYILENSPKKIHTWIRFHDGIRCRDEVHRQTMAHIHPTSKLRIHKQHNSITVTRNRREKTT